MHTRHQTSQVARSRAQPKGIASFWMALGKDGDGASEVRAMSPQREEAMRSISHAKHCTHFLPKRSLSRTCRMARCRGVCRPDASNERTPNQIPRQQSPPPKSKAAAGPREWRAGNQKPRAARVERVRENESRGTARAQSVRESVKGSVCEREMAKKAGRREPTRGDAPKRRTATRPRAAPRRRAATRRAVRPRGAEACGRKTRRRRATR